MPRLKIGLVAGFILSCIVGIAGAGEPVEWDGLTLEMLVEGRVEPKKAEDPPIPLMKSTRPLPLTLRYAGYGILSDNNRDRFSVLKDKPEKQTAGIWNISLTGAPVPARAFRVMAVVVDEALAPDGSPL